MHPRDAPHLFVQKNNVNEFNYKVHNAMSAKKFSINTHNSVIGAHSHGLRDKVLKQIPSDHRKLNNCILF